MKKIYDTTKKIAVTIVALSTLLVSCNDDVLSEANHLFRPIATVTSTTSNMRAMITAEWKNAVSGADSYGLELYRDSLGPEDTQFTPVATATTTELKYTFGEKEELAWDSQYYIRVKAIGAKDSKFFVCKVATTDDYPTHLKPISEVIDVDAIVRWETTTEKYTVLDITNSKDSVLMRLDISNATNSFKTTGLEPNTTYKAKIYVGAMPDAPAVGKPFTAMPDNAYRGKKVFKTLASQAYSNMRDLTVLSDEEAQGMICTAFLDTVADNATVLLKAGLTYTVDGATFNNKSIKFISKYSLEGYANIAIKANFKLVNNNDIEKLEFENLNLFTLGANESTTNYGGGYIFNINTKSNVNTILLKGCNISFFRGVVRTQAGPVIDNLLLENCKINRIGGYGIVTCDNADSKILNISMTKSTITYADKAIASSKAEGCTEKVTVDQCTFCYSPITDSKTSLFDFGSITVQAKITNSIFGASRIEKGKGVCAWNGSKASQDVAGSYVTKDFEYALNDAGAISKPFDSAMGKYSNSSTDLFKDPENLDFTIIDNKIGDAGDPRWK